MQVSTEVNVSHFLIVVCDDFDEVTHDVGKESYTTEHDNDSNESLVIADWVIISVAYSTQCGKCIVTTYYQLVRSCIFLQIKFFNECILTIQIAINGTEQKPKAPNKISQYNSNHYKPDNFINIKHFILSYDLVVT